MAGPSREPAEESSEESGTRNSTETQNNERGTERPVESKEEDGETESSENGTRVNSEEQRETNGKNLVLIKEMARSFVDQSKYYEASAILEVLEVFEKEHDPSTLLIMGECFLRLDKKQAAMKCIATVRDYLVADPVVEANLAFGMIESMVESKSYLRALIFLPVVASLYKILETPKDAVEGIFRCIKKAEECSTPLIGEGGRSRVLAIEFGLEFMEKYSQNMFQMTLVDPGNLARRYCKVACWIGEIYMTLGAHDKTVSAIQRAVEYMRDNCPGGTAKQHRIYGRALYNMGMGYAALERAEQAKEAFSEAINVVDVAIDFKNDTERYKELDTYRQKLRELN